jgi:hypothetical protein
MTLRRVLWLVALGLVLAAPARASEWESGDVDAARRYRELERERAERFRAERAIGTAPARVEAGGGEPAASARWRDRLLEPFDLDAIREAFARLLAWLEWLQREVVPFFERWIGDEAPPPQGASPEPVRAERRAAPKPAAAPAPPRPPAADDSWLPESLRDAAPPDDPARAWRGEERRRLEGGAG